MLTFETQAGDPIAIGDLRLVPIARSARLELGHGALLWHRAAAVRARSASGETVIPIPDLTRRLQLAALGAGLLGALLLRCCRRWRSGDRK